MSSEENTDLVRRLVDEVLNGKQLPRLRELCEPGELCDHLERELPNVFTAFPDVRYAIDDQVVENEKIAVRLGAAGTQSGFLEGLPPSGERVQWSVMLLCHVAGGKIARGWLLSDRMAMVQQLGAHVEPENLYPGGAAGS